MKEQIIQWAREADAYADAMDIGGKNYVGLRDEYFAELVAKHEREQCAKVCDNLDAMSRDPMVAFGSASECAEAIRARSKQ